MEPVDLQPFTHSTKETARLRRYSVQDTASIVQGTHLGPNMTIYKRWHTITLFNKTQLFEHETTASQAQEP